MLGELPRLLGSVTGLLGSATELLGPATELLGGVSTWRRGRAYRSRMAVRDAGKETEGGGKRPPFVVPFLRNHRFVGREGDLAQVHLLLQKEGPVGVLPVAAAGMGGIGKTQSPSSTRTGMPGTTRAASTG